MNNSFQDKVLIVASLYENIVNCPNCADPIINYFHNFDKAGPLALALAYKVIDINDTKDTVEFTHLIEHAYRIFDGQFDFPVLVDEDRDEWYSISEIYVCKCPS